MNGKEKLYFLLDTIDDVRAIAPSGQPLIIDPINDLNNKLTEIELKQLFTKLEKDEQVLRVLQIPSGIKRVQIVEDLDPYDTSYQNDDGCWHIELTPSFDDYFQRIQQEPKYQEFTGKRPQKDEPIVRKDIFAIRTFSPKALKIAGSFSSENYQFVLMVLKEIISLSEFSSDGKVHYQLQSPPGQTLIKERSLLKKFEAEEMFRHLGEDGIYGIATLNNLDIELIKEVIARIEEYQSGVISAQEGEFDEMSGKDENTTSELTQEKQLADNLPLPQWQDDFEWKGKVFVFGNFGRTGAFTSKPRLNMMRELTRAKGGWVTVRELKTVTNKDAVYVRTTIGQIERGLNSNLRECISIPSTGELLRATMRKNEKSIGLNKRKLTVRLPSYILPMKNTI